MIAIVDYGVGNLFSLKSSLEAIGIEGVVTNDRDILASAEKIILPGVGAFCDAMEKLKKDGLDKYLISLANEGKPLMGICLGMQMLFDKSYEYGCYDGLGLISGEVRPIYESFTSDEYKNTLKIPQIGWNSLSFGENKHPIFKYLDEGDFVYFVHSYSAVNCKDSIIATTDYGGVITASVAKNNVCGCQFHPEKSGKLGLAILKAFAEWEVSL